MPLANFTPNQFRVHVFSSSSKRAQEPQPNNYIIYSFDQGKRHKNGCMYECWMSNRIWWFLEIKNLTAIFKVARYFSARCVRRLEEHTKNTGNKVERSLVPFHIRSQMTQMHWCYSKCVCVSLGRHPHLIIFRILDSVSSLAIILLGIGSRLYYSFGFLFVNQFSLHQ